MNIKKAGIIFLSAVILSVGSLKADEGMWMLPLIQKLNIKKMSEMGFNPTCSLFNKIVEKSGKNAAFSW